MTISWKPPASTTHSIARSALILPYNLNTIPIPTQPRPLTLTPSGLIFLLSLDPDHSCPVSKSH